MPSNWNKYWYHSSFPSSLAPSSSIFCISYSFFIDQGYRDHLYLHVNTFRTRSNVVFFVIIWITKHLFYGKRQTNLKCQGKTQTKLIWLCNICGDTSTSKTKRREIIIGLLWQNLVPHPKQIDFIKMLNFPSYPNLKNNLWFMFNFPFCQLITGRMMIPISMTMRWEVTRGLSLQYILICWISHLKKDLWSMFNFPFCHLITGRIIPMSMTMIWLKYMLICWISHLKKDLWSMFNFPFCHLITGRMIPILGGRGCYNSSPQRLSGFSYNSSKGSHTIEKIKITAPHSSIFFFTKIK